MSRLTTFPSPISIYDESKLDKARASSAELTQVTGARPSAPPASPRVAAPTPTPRLAPATPPAALADSDDWTKDEFARRSAKSSVDINVGGRVYVRGYYRKNATDVSPHSRR